MYKAELFSITKGSNNEFQVNVLVSYHGIEEEATFRYSGLKNLPRHLFLVKDGVLKYKRGTPLKVSHPHEDACGLKFLYLYPENAL